MVGRLAEREVLTAAYARAAAGEPQVVLITGAAGIGKTRLVEELSRHAEQAGARVRAGESAPLAGAALAYGPFVAALGDQAEWLLDDGGQEDMLAARHRLFVRVLGLLGELASRATLVLVLEDLHWADESSRELLAFLAVRLRRVPLLLAATVREEGLDSGLRRWLAEMEGRPGVSRVRLAGLADAEIAELVTGLFPHGVSGPGVRRGSRRRR
jgi:predicted ATPase